MKTNVANHRNWLAVAVAAIAGLTLTQAAEPTLKVGDVAPPLQVAKWVQGEPVKQFDRDKAYIVEFWATWCGPCRVSIPHLNELHNKFKGKGLVVIGQDVWERDEALVEPFIKKMGDKMTYRVALDDKKGSEKGKMAETWMEAAGQNGIPSAFVVDKQGLIAWIGHPMQLKETVLEQVLDGKYDVKKAAADFARQKENEAKLTPLYRELGSNIRQKDWAKAEATVGEIEQLLPADERDNMGMARFNILLGKKDYPAAYQLATRLSETQKDNAMAQNQLAWQIATREDIETRDLNVAEKIARRGNEAAQGKDPAILDTLARVLFMNGKKSEAIEIQEKAVKLADGDMKAELQKVLDSYKEGKLPKAQ